MNLPDLLSVLGNKYSSVFPSPATEVLGLTADTREVRPGWVFVAVRGTKNDGHQYVPQAIEQGACALVVEDAASVPSSYKGVLCLVEDGRQALDSLAAQLYGNPSLEMLCVGVTGTNGKTSVTYLLEHVFNWCRIPIGVLGTVNHRLGDRVWPTEMTTPGPVDLQKRLREMKDAGAKAVVLEVSSHALAQSRADGVRFNTVIFTNLTRDHLDYHQTMGDYFQAKQRLFTDLLWKSPKVPLMAVVNTDDDWGRRLRVASKAMVWTYGQKPSDFEFRPQRMDFSGTDFTLKTPAGEVTSRIPLCGRHNLYNSVAVIAAAASCGISIRRSLEALAAFPGVPGRMQKVANSKNLHVFVDYAHSPDALENVLRTIDEIRKVSKAPAQVWTVFGCGGDRDRGKRKLMAEVACRWSDQVMITSDNPRSENPTSIIKDILEGVPAEMSAKVATQVDRRQALVEVLARAQSHDVVLIAGKGHEKYQIIGDQKIRFDDVETAKELLL